MARGPILAFVICGAVAFGASFARAESPEDAAEARNAYAEGDQAFQEGRFADAIRLFTRGYELSGRPRFLLNIAHAQRLSGHSQEALETYRKFLATDPRPEDRDQAQAAVSEIEAALAATPASGSTGGADTPAAGPVQPVAPPTAPAAAPPSDPLMHERAAAQTDDESGLPWYFWAGIGAAVVAGVVIVMVASGGDDAPGFRDMGTWGRVDL